MQYRSLDQIGAEADVLAAPDLPIRTTLSRRERLERWAEILEQEPRRGLFAIHDIEYKSPQDSSPIGWMVRHCRWRTPIRCCVRLGSGATRSAMRASSSACRTTSCIIFSASAITER